MPRRREDMNYITCSSSSSSLSPASPIVCRRFYTPATTTLSCDFVLDAVADDHHIVTDTNTTTTPVSAPPVHARTARVPENNAHCTHGANCIDMTGQDEDELFPSGNGDGLSPSAFAAVSHYSYVEPGESERLAMNEVINVNAVVGSERHPRGLEGGRRRGGASGRREEDYAVEDEDLRESDVGMRSLASADRDIEDDEEEEDPDDARKLYPDAVARSGDEVPDGGVSLAGVPDVGYEHSRWDEYGDIPYDYEDSCYEDEDYEHEDGEEEEEDSSEEDEVSDEAHEQRVLQSLYEIEEISGRAIQAGINFAGANPLEMVDMIADFANEFPVTSMWPKPQMQRGKSKHPKHTDMHELTLCNQHTNATLQLTNSSTNGSTKLTVSHTTVPRMPSTWTVQRRLFDHPVMTIWSSLICNRLTGIDCEPSGRTLVHNAISGIVPTITSSMRRRTRRSSSTSPSSTFARRPCTPSIERRSSTSSCET